MRDCEIFFMDAISLLLIQMCVSDSYHLYLDIILYLSVIIKVFKI